MQEWCMEHPIMTFILIMMVLSQPLIVVKFIRKDHKKDSKQ